MRQVAVSAIVRLAVVAALFGGTTRLHAALITWDVNATFDDGGSATGFFQFDSDKFAATGNGLGDFDILTTRGSELSGANYASGFFITNAESTPFSTSITNSLGHLILQHRLPLTDSGGIIPLTEGTEDFGGLASRAIVVGQLVAQVPEASQSTMIAVGALLLAGGLFFRRENRFFRRENRYSTTVAR